MPNADLIGLMNTFQQSIQEQIDVHDEWNVNSTQIDTSYAMLTVALAPQADVPSPLHSVLPPAGITLSFKKDPLSKADALVQGKEISDRVAETPYAVAAKNFDDATGGVKVSFVDETLNPVDRALRNATSDELKAFGSPLYPVRIAHLYKVTRASRNSDSNPFYGGDLIHGKDPNHGWCTGGFVVFYGSGSARTDGMVTADHCGQDFFYTTGKQTNNTVLVGRTHSVSSSTDSQMIIAGAGYYRYVFRGTWNSSDARAVRNAGNPSLNQQVCNSGAFSGEFCQLTVTDLNPDTTEPDINQNGYTVENLAQRCVAQPGDSGGPNYMVNTDDDSRTLRGMIIGIDYQYPARCPQGNADVDYGQGSYVGFDMKIQSITRELQVAVSSIANP